MTWRNLRQAAQYLGPKRSPRFVAREIKAGRIRAAQIGGRGEYVTCDEWLDAYVEQQAKPVTVPIRKRA